MHNQDVCATLHSDWEPVAVRVRCRYRGYCRQLLCHGLNPRNVFWCSDDELARNSSNNINLCSSNHLFVSNTIDDWFGWIEYKDKASLKRNNGFHAPWLSQRTLTRHWECLCLVIIGICFLQIRWRRYKIRKSRNSGWSSPRLIFGPSIR